MKLKVGDPVHYLGSNGVENGRVKGFNADGIPFVVYHCNGEWGNYQQYTGAATPLELLRTGWFLSERYCYMIAHAMKVVGAKQAYDYIREDVYAIDADLIEVFIEYIYENSLPYTERTANSIFSLFIKDYLS